MAKKPAPKTGLQRSEQSVKAWQKAGKPGSLLGWQTKRLLTGGNGAAGATAPATTKTTTKKSAPTMVSSAAKKPAPKGRGASPARQRLKLRARK